MGEAAVYMVFIDKNHVRGKAPPCKHMREYNEQAGQAGMQDRHDREHSEIREIGASTLKQLRLYHRTRKLCNY